MINVAGGVAEAIPITEDPELRAHHAEALALFFAGGLAVGEVVARSQQYAETLAQRGKTWGNYYSYPNEAAAAAFNTTAQSELERFLALPEDAPVWLADNRKDGICAGCSDDHCRKPMTRDADFLRATSETAQELGIALSSERIETVDKIGQPVQITRLKLTAGDARRIFSDPYFLDRTIASEKERRDAIRRRSLILTPPRRLGP